MISARPDLNGLRLIVPGDTKVWLVFNGMRHHICGPAVYDSLFNEIDKLTSVKEIDGILRGPDLNHGTCLARSDASGATFLVTGFPALSVRRYYIQSWEDFVAFGFDESRVRIVPDLIITALAAGRPIQATSVVASGE